MSSRVTRNSKNKKSRCEEEAGSASEILRRICATGDVTKDDIDQLYCISKPVCQGCRVNSKDNPNCFCGLVPPSNGYRKAGLWQKIPDVLLNLGHDPSEELRVDEGWPAGLTNLGATCYANSILQCLYMNLKFRAGVFAVEPELLRQNPVLDELAKLFAGLHSSVKAFIDSSPFIKKLELDNEIQQDSHEFLTLLLNLLEQSLSRSKVPNSRTIVQDLFVGSVSNVTRCSKCGQDSEASSKAEDFYHLELGIQGFKNLDESLDDYLSMEKLSGDNQYSCVPCGIQVDATRWIKLRTLPDVLNFQLKRCIFLPKSTTGKKITSSISFPGELQMKHRLNEPSQSELLYDLSAILVHKGAGVNCGHYLSIIKDEQTGEWWEFDDETVSKKGYHPFGEDSSSSTAEPMETEPNLQPPCSEQMVVSNGNHVDVGQVHSSASNNGCQAKTFESSDAYMLMYRRRSTTESKNKGFKDSERCSEPVPQRDDKCLPPHLFEEMKILNDSYLSLCRSHKQKKEKETAGIAERRQEVRSILSEAPASSVEEPYFWITTDWLRQWADTNSPPVIDNTSIQCSHGRVSVSKVGSMKRLSEGAWTRLLSKYGGGPTLSNDDLCIECLRDGAKTMVRANDYRDQRSSFKEIADASLAGKSLDGTLYYVSRPWLQQWSRRKNVDFPGDADIGPTASIRCPHGELMPEQAAGAKRVLVPEDLWLFLYEDSNKVKPGDVLGCSTFPSEAESCAICSVELNEVACFEDTLRAAKIKERQNHEKLLLGKNDALNPGSKYYLLPSSWLTKWRSYITASGKMVSSPVAARPDPLEGVIDSLICGKHSRLLERPLDLYCKRGLILQKPSTTDGLTLISENDWKFFCEDWQVANSKCVSAEIEFSNGDVKKLVVSSEEMPISEANLNPSNDEVEPRQPTIKTYPMICEECIGERESRELTQKLSYFDKEISVVLVRGKEAPRSVLDASCAVSDPDRRVSKRSRKTSDGNTVNLKVSGSMSIYQLKMMIWESFGVVKENQMLHKRTRQIEEESATLADMNIFPGDVLWVRDSGIYENRDIADEISGQHSEVKRTEGGFRGTLLTACISNQDQ
ncbi:hypothetical protein MKW98_009187 [Papaver atlanticum]|uniref:Ubiquitin carboxyl-terminal hydrolase 26 n=1 Tax=Papaver atlanticum TaxID=357466 RepID=A0AAD4S1M3_9MAGN|nr:hypothetical protein MKW98_009187 [Papaver atlanticum]